MSQKRPIKAIAIPGIEPGMADTPQPVVRMVDPSDLLVDEQYQRNLSERSVTLIRKIVSAWDWARYKPPIVAVTDDGLEVIDGQHTAIAAACHPLIGEIPVMVVEAAQMADRAKAFVGHNRDRIALTAQQMHGAALAAGDEDALTIENVCKLAGVKVLRVPPGTNVFRPGETLAIGSIRALINRRHAMGARRVLQVLADANCAPVGANGIKAVETLLFDEEYAGQVAAEDLTTTIIAMGMDGAEAEARVFAVAHGVRLHKALTVVLFRKTRRVRRRAA